MNVPNSTALMAQPGQSQNKDVFNCIADVTNDAQGFIPCIKNIYGAIETFQKAKANYKCAMEQFMMEMNELHMIEQRQASTKRKL